MYGTRLRASPLATARRPDGALRAGLLLRADGRRPGLHAEDLLRARADGDRGAVRLRARRRSSRSSTCARATARWDLRSYVAIHMSLIFGVGVLITGSIWAQGVVGPLVGVGRADARLVPDRLPALRDLPAAALLDRGPRAPGALRSVFAIIAGAFVPLNFIAVRARASAYMHPRVLRRRPAATCPATMRLAFLVCARRHGAAVRRRCGSYEMAAKHTRAQLRALRRKLGGDEAAPRRAAAPRRRA